MSVLCMLFVTQNRLTTKLHQSHSSHLILYQYSTLCLICIGYKRTTVERSNQFVIETDDINF